MINAISFAHKIVLYWDLPENHEAGNTYKISLNEKIIGETKKSHFEVCNLTPATEYKFTVSMIGEIICFTESRKEKIDITQEHYNAIGDGKTLNTEKIQAAINDCKENQYVYIPSGDFMTGSLYLHSNMELYLDEGTILHGTYNVEDYGPKIKSRFEGHEMMCYAGLLNIGELDHERGYTCSNVRITGKGTVCGGGKTLAQNVVDVEQYF